FEGEPPPQHGRAAPEAPPPEGMAEHRDRMVARTPIVGRRQEAAEGRPDAEQREGIPRHPLRAHPLLAPGGIVEDGGPAPSLVVHAEEIHVRPARLAETLEERV